MTREQFNEFLRLVARPVFAFGLIYLILSYATDPRLIAWASLAIATCLIGLVLFMGYIDDN